MWKGTLNFSCGHEQRRYFMKFNVYVHTDVNFQRLIACCGTIRSHRFVFLLTFKINLPLYLNMEAEISCETYYSTHRLRWSRGSVLAVGTQVRGFKPGRSSWIFQGEKILSTPSFGREVKPFVSCTACKRTRKCMRGSRSFRLKLPAISRPSISSFHY